MPRVQHNLNLDGREALYFSRIPFSLIGMNHACFSIKFLVFFIAKMHDSQSFSLILR